MGVQDARSAPIANRARSRVRSCSAQHEWRLVWGSFRQAFPLLWFVALLGGAWLFNLSAAANLAFGSYLVRPTSACVSGLLVALGKHPAWTDAVGGAIVRLDLGTGSLWIQPQCTTVGAWTIWLVFLLAVPVGWRVRAIALPVGLAALWILNVVRLDSVLLLHADGRHSLAKAVDDHVWPWLTALTLAAVAWAFVRGAPQQGCGRGRA